MTTPLILVTGATGKTGASVVEQLLERGYTVRAFVHKLDDRSLRLSHLGAAPAWARLPVARAS